MVKSRAGLPIATKKKILKGALSICSSVKKKLCLPCNYPQYSLLDAPFSSPIPTDETSQAAGMVTIAHRSGGPAADIVVPLPDGRVTGFLAETPEEYAKVMAVVFGTKCFAQNKDRVDDASQFKEISGTIGNRSNESVPERAMGGGGSGVGGVSSQAVRVAGRETARRFSNEAFDRSFAAEFAKILQPFASARSALRRERKNK